jgi:hypothetical protein
LASVSLPLHRARSASSLGDGIQQCGRDRGRAASPASAGAGGAVTRLRSVPTEPRAPTKHGPCWWCSRAAARRRLQLRGQNQPALASPFPYIVNICFKCFSCYQRHVTSVSYGYYKSRSGCCICCKCFRDMLQVFQRHVISVCSKCFIYFRRMLQAVLICMLYMFDTYIATVCSKCFTCFSLMLQ